MMDDFPRRPFSGRRPRIELGIGCPIEGFGDGTITVLVFRDELDTSCGVHANLLLVEKVRTAIAAEAIVVFAPAVENVSRRRAAFDLLAQFR